MKYFIFSIIFITFFGCRKFVQAPLPTTELVGANVYNSNSTAAAAVTGIYQTMTGNSVGGGPDGISAICGLSADEFTLFPGANPLLQQVYSNAQLSTNPPTIWSDLYNLIYLANSAIAGITASTDVASNMKQQLIGESQFIRGFCYFYLVNLYGSVPLVLTPNYVANTGLSRASESDVWRQITVDLYSAQNLLSASYLTPSGMTTSERVRPNSFAASALLARVYLYEGAYDSAEIEASTVINSGNYGLVLDLDSAFLANNTEAIWQLESPNSGLNTYDGQTFLLSDFGGPSAFFPFILSNALEADFEPGDLRAVHWTDSIVESNVVYYFPFKYKLYYTGQPPTEYTTFLRLAEQYLIRAEARAQQGKLTGTNSAISDLNIIRSRAGLAASIATSLPEILVAIQQERRVELFTEYGHRWLDLKRTQKLDSVMSMVTPQKGGSWTATDSLYPIPIGDIRADANLTQNPGYN